jgi:hypothetical protein
MNILRSKIARCMNYEEMEVVCMNATRIETWIGGWMRGELITQRPACNLRWGDSSAEIEKEKKWRSKRMASELRNCSAYLVPAYGRASCSVCEVRNTS